MNKDLIENLVNYNKSNFKIVLSPKLIDYHYNIKPDVIKEYSEHIEFDSNLINSENFYINKKFILFFKNKYHNFCLKSDYINFFDFQDSIFDAEVDSFLFSKLEYFNLSCEEPSLFFNTFKITYPIIFLKHTVVTFIYSIFVPMIDNSQTIINSEFDELSKTFKNFNNLIEINFDGNNIELEV